MVGGLLLLIGLWVVLGVLSWSRDDASNAGDSTVTERQTVQRDGNLEKTPEETELGSVIGEVSPAVVSVLTESDAEPFFYRESMPAGAGTGVVVDPDGYVLTNKHVVADASSVSVIFEDGTRHDGVRVVATDPLNDLAYLKIVGVSGLTTAELGDSTTVRVGQRVLAIGNSLGLYQNTVTSGIISGTGRPIRAQSADSVETLTDLLQTDAAINPGNSGGPLLNNAKQVIGINTAVVEDAEGIGFAIPINAAKGILKQILAGDKNPQRAYLGVRFMPINAAIARQLDLSVSQGAYVYSEGGGAAVVSGSPAAAAGIREGDVITNINGVAVGPRGGVSSLVAEYAPGDTIKVKLRRGDEELVRNVTLTAYRS